MLKEVVLKSHDSTVDRTDLSAVGVFIPNNDSVFVEVETIVTFSELLCNGDNTDISAV
jgi:hypothetical protein